MQQGILRFKTWGCLSPLSQSEDLLYMGKDQREREGNEEGCRKNDVLHGDSSSP